MPLPALALGAKLLGVRKFLAGIPWQVWIGLALLAAIGLGIWRHGVAVKRLKEEQYAIGWAEGRDSRDAEIFALQDQLAEKIAPIVADVKEKHNEEVRTVNRRTDALLVRGPGKATCPNPPTVPSAASEPQPGPGPANGNVAGVPSDRGAFIALPYTDTVKFARQCDLNRAAAASWATWYNRISAEWNKAAKAAEGQR